MPAVDHGQASIKASALQTATAKTALAYDGRKSVETAAINSGWCGSCCSRSPRFGPGLTVSQGAGAGHRNCDVSIESLFLGGDPRCG